MEELFVEAAREKPRMILITEGALEGYVVMEVVEGRASAEALIEVAEADRRPLYPSASRNWPAH